MLKRKILAFLAAVALACGAVGCKAESEPMTPQTYAAATSAATEETTTAPQNADIGIETLAEGEERDYKIEDILKNDLEIDGIPISLPCTLNELLETLGDDYSVNKSDIKDSFKRAKDKDNITKSKYFTGKFVTVFLDYKNADEEYICSQLVTIIDSSKIDFDSINVIGYMEVNCGKLSLNSFSAGDSVDKYVERYGNPNEIKFGEKYSGLIYKDDDCRVVINVETQNSSVIDSFMITFETETEEL